MFENPKKVRSFSTIFSNYHYFHITAKRLLLYNSHFSVYAYFMLSWTNLLLEKQHFVLSINSIHCTAGGKHLLGNSPVTFLLI